MFVRRPIQAGISLGGVIVEPSLNHARAHLLRDCDCPVAAEGIQDDDVVCLTHRSNTVGKIAFFVQRQDEDGQAHNLRPLYAGRS